MNPLKLFKPQDKFLIQMSVDLGSGISGGMSVNLPVTTDIQAMHDVMDKMRRVQDRQRAITELPVFEEKLELMEAQIEATQKNIVKYTEEAKAEERQYGAPKTGTKNAIDNNQQNLEKLQADVKIGRLRVENIKKRIATDEQNAADIRALNQLSVAA